MENYSSYKSRKISVDSIPTNLDRAESGYGLVFPK